MKTVDAERLLDYLQERAGFFEKRFAEARVGAGIAGELARQDALGRQAAYTDVLNWIESHLK